MRGAPFTENNFSRGLNVLDSPYSLQAGETRDCLNVVSTPRGAVKKRTGSTLFASGGVGNFPTLAVTDNFNRADEAELSNGGKYTKLPESLGYLGTGENKTNVYRTGAVQGKWGARWNVGEQNNPAVSLDVVSSAGYLGEYFEVWACLNSEGTSGYCAKWTFSYETEVGTFYDLELVKRVAGVDTFLGSNNGLRLQDKSKIGLSVRGGLVTVWKYQSAAEPGWFLVLKLSDATYTKGYSGFGGNTEKFGAVLFAAGMDNFVSGEMTAPVTSGTPHSLAAVVTSSFLTPYLILGVGKKLASVSKEGVVTQIKELTSEARVSIIQSATGKTKVQGPVFIVNGVDKPQYWKGDTPGEEAKPWEVQTAELLGVKYFSEEVGGGIKGPPNGKYMVVAGNRIFMAGMANDTSAVRFSGFVAATGGGSQPDPTLWPEENVVRFERSDATPITGLGVWGPYVLVFKGHKTYVVYNLDEGENRRISDSVGCVAHRSIVETPQGTFFLTPDQGVYSTNGSSVREVSRNVRPILQGTDSKKDRAAKVNELSNAAGGFANGHYYLSYMAQDETMKTLDYDIVLQSWWLHDLAGNQWVLWEPSVGAAALYTIPNKAEAGVVKAFVEAVYKDSGANYTGAKALTAYWLSAWEPFFQYVLRHRINAPNQKKRVRQLFFDGSGQIIPLIFKNFAPALVQEPATVENEDSSAPKKPVNLTDESGWAESEGLWGEGGGIWGEEVETGAARLYALGIARVWGVGFGNASDKPFEVDSYQYTVQFRKS